MRKWLLLLGGLVIWAAHFFLLYAFASLFPATDLARLLTLAVTGVALAANAVLISSGVAVSRKADDLDQWVGRVGFAEALLSFIAVLWQGFPALF